MVSIDISVPDGRRGDWAVESFTVSDADAERDRMRAMFSGSYPVPAGSYKRLVHRGSVVMSNTPMEVQTHSEIIRRARGNVLINGLGLGMVLVAILAKPEVDRVTVVELSQDVIGLVGPRFTGHDRLHIVHADALTWSPPKGERYQAVWHDIWPSICADNLDDMKRLHRRYARRADWQGSRCRIECERLADRDRRRGR